MSILSLLIGFIIGLIIAYLISINIGKIPLGPNSSDIRNNIYRDDNNKQYRLEPYVCVCPIFNI